jgi:hypothetical protein
MPTPTVAFSCRIVPEAQEAIRRLSSLTRWSQPRLIEAIILEFQDRWLARFSGEERRRYEAGAMTFAEAFEIRRRALKQREPVPPLAVKGVPSEAAIDAAVVFGDAA